MVWCTSCGTKLEETVVFCWRCGTRTKGSPSKGSCKRAVTATQPSEPEDISGGSVDEERNDTCMSKQLSLNLSEGAMKSLLNLKRTVESGGKGRKLGSGEKGRKLGSGETGRKLPSNPPSFLKRLDIGVQLLDRDMNPVRKSFQSKNLICLNVDPKSNELDWIKEVNSYFKKDVCLKTKVLSESGYRSPDQLVDCRQLQVAKARRRLAGLRVYMQAVGFDKKQLKQLYIGRKEKHVSPISVDTSDDEDLPPIKRSCSKAKELDDAPYDTSAPATDPPAVNPLPAVDPSKFDPPNVDQQAGDNKSPDTTESKQPTLGAKEMANFEKEPEQDLEHIDVKDVDTDTSPPTVELGLKALPTEDNSPGVDISPVTFDLQADDNNENDGMDSELSNFLQLQDRLLERKKNSAQRLAATPKKEMKQFNIFYKARGNRGICFKADVEAAIGTLYDSVCVALESGDLAPQFFLKDTQGKEFRTDFPGKARDIPSTLFIEEEDYSLDTTITNYDEVFF